MPARARGRFRIRMEEAWANGDVVGRGPAPALRLKRGVRLRYGYRERIHSGCGPVLPGRGRGVLRILVHIAALVALYLAFSGALFLGLQVSPLYGNLGLAPACGLAGLYVWLGFVRR